MPTGRPANPIFADPDFRERVQREKRRVRLVRNSGRSHSAVKLVFSTGEGPRGANATVARLQAKSDLRHIDRNTPGHVGGFKPYARHAR